MDEENKDKKSCIKPQSVVFDANDYTTSNVNFDRCEINQSMELDAQNLSGIGRYLNLSATVKNVCPNKRIAIGMALYETTGGCRVLKGHKAFVASHSERCCTDITLNNIHFVLPEEIAEVEDTSHLCHRRNFEMEFTSHYVDM